VLGTEKLEKFVILNYESVLTRPENLKIATEEFNPTGSVTDVWVRSPFTLSLGTNQ
jgi:hypothetical protein